jgi:hypothetical protein
MSSLPTSRAQKLNQDLGGIVCLLLGAALLLASCGRTQSLDCHHGTDRCVKQDWHWGIPRTSVEFSPTRYVDVIIQSRSVTRGRSSRLSSVYFLLIGAYHGLSYTAPDEYDSRSDPKLLQQFSETQAFIANEREGLSLGTTFKVWHLAFGIPGVLLLYFGLRGAYRAISTFLRSRPPPAETPSSELEVEQHDR